MDFQGPQYYFPSGFLLIFHFFVCFLMSAFFDSALSFLCNSIFASMVFFSLIFNFCLQGELFKDRATAMQCLVERGDEAALDQVFIFLTRKPFKFNQVLNILDFHFLLKMSSFRFGMFTSRRAGLPNAFPRAGWPRATPRTMCSSPPTGPG